MREVWAREHPAMPSDGVLRWILGARYTQFKIQTNVKMQRPGRLFMALPYQPAPAPVDSTP